MLNRNYMQYVIARIRQLTGRSNLIILLSLFTLFSCKKEIVSNAPSIEFVKVNPSTVEIGKSNLTITISYKDADGDLGENNPDVKNLFVTDNRNGVVYQFRVQQLSPSGATISIQGQLDIAMPNVGITDGVTLESATFSIYMKDRAGNQSNTVTSSSVNITTL